MPGWASLLITSLVVCSGEVGELSTETFDRVLRARPYAFVAFTAPWCAHRREAARRRCRPRKPPPAWVRHRGRSSRGHDSWRYRRGGRPDHRGKPPGRREPSAAGCIRRDANFGSGRPGAGHIEGPEAATAARLQVMSASCWRRILHHRCRGEAQPAGGLVQRPRGGSEVRSRLHGGRGGTFGTEGGPPGRRGGP